MWREQGDVSKRRLLLITLQGSPIFCFTVRWFFLEYN